MILGATLVTVLALLSAACGGSAGSQDSSSQPSGPAETEKPAATEPAAAPASTEEPMSGPNSSDPTRIKVEARDSVFDVQPAQGVLGRIEAPANTEITVTLQNEGTLPHNIAFLTKQGGSPLADGANGDIIMEGESDTLTFKTPAAGTYFFQCTVHPQEMIGEFVVN